jgi:hypothetical protein
VNPSPKGTGFKFIDYTSIAFWAIKRALQYRDRPVWEKIMVRAQPRLLLGKSAGSM